MKEHAVYRALHNALPLAHFLRIESATAMGIPDLNVCYNGFECWVELKLCRRDGKALMRKEQRAWGYARSTFGMGRVFLAAGYYGSSATRLAAIKFFRHPIIHGEVAYAGGVPMFMVDEDKHPPQTLVLDGGSIRDVDRLITILFTSELT